MFTRSGPPRRSSLAVTLALTILAVALLAPPPAAASAAGSDVGPSTETAAASKGDFSINLYRKGDFVSQATAYWCVGASMQMMLNIVTDADERSRAVQERNMRVARSGGQSNRQANSGEAADPPAGGLRGAGSGGWARGLGTLGAGLYEQRALGRYGTAVQEAARALRMTGRPVGLIVWRGKHAWVMTGFTATADPLLDPDFKVTGVYIQDPWYPRVSSIWGPGQRPNSWLSVKTLRSDFLPRQGGRWHPELAGKFVVVMPVDPVRSVSPAFRYL